MCSIRPGLHQCSRSVLVGRRVLFFLSEAVLEAGWVSYFWMTHTHIHTEPLCPLYHTLWDIIYDSSVTYGLFITQWQQSLSSVFQHIVSLPPLPHVFPSSLSFFISLFYLFCFLFLCQRSWSHFTTCSMSGIEEHLFSSVQICGEYTVLGIVSFLFKSR